MGILCVSTPPRRKANIVAALPFQLASRQKDAVASYTDEYFRGLLDGNRSWSVIGGYHSHPTCARDNAESLCLPSKTDLLTMDVGDVEVIVRVMRKRQRMSNFWKTNPSGSISIAWGRFQFLIRAFVRLDGVGKNKWPLYRKVKLELEI